jgi:hypothetical protein
MANKTNATGATVAEQYDFNELLTNYIITKNPMKNNSNVIPLPSNGATVAASPVMEYDPLSIFGEKYPTPEEWEKEFLPDGRICPLCGSVLNLIIESPSNEDADIINLECENKCSKPYLYGKLGCMPPDTRFVKRQKDNYEKENTSYGKQGKKNYDGELDLVCMADIESEEWNWLWYPYFPYGAMSLIDGDPAAGKTFLAIDMMAKVSKGDCFFLEMGVVDREPGNVIYCTSENSRSKSIKNRLIGAGADQSRIYHFEGVKHKEGYTVPFDFSEEGIKPLYRAMDKLKPKLLVIDPLQAYIGCDMNKAEQTRPNLQRLVALAEKYQCAVVIIRHTTKGKQQKGAFRGMGSQDILGTARGGVYIGEDKDTGQKVLTHAKFNESVKGESLAYIIEENTDNGKPYVKWVGVSQKTADDLNDPDNKSGEDKSAIEEAIDFLEKTFEKEQKILSSEVINDAKKQGLSLPTINRAKKTIKENKDYDYYFESEKEGRNWYMVKCFK